MENEMETPHLFWCNLKTNGLRSELSWSRILEVAVVLTDFDLKRIASYEAVLMYSRTSIPHAPSVDEMYTKNGLWGDCVRSQLTIEQAQTHLLRFVLTHCNEEKPILAGSSLASLVFPFLRLHLPTLSAALCTRSFDVEGVRMVMEGWGGVEGFLGAQSHRAMPELRETLENAQRFRKIIQRWRKESQYNGFV
jgi:oligoribonuclease